MSSSAAPFSLALECPFDAARMHAQAEPLLGQPGQGLAVEPGIFGLGPLEHVQDGLGELVSPLRPRPLRQQPRQARLLERRLGLIEGRAREAEAGTGLAHSLPILASPPQHLVLDLDQIVGVEEGIAGGEGGVAHGLGPGVEGMLTSKGGNLVGRGVGDAKVVLRSGR